MSRRKMLAADEKLANKITAHAKNRNATVYLTVNEMLSQALKAEEHGYSLGELIAQRQGLDDAADIGVGLTVDNVFTQILDLCVSLHADQVEHIWRQTGQWYGKYFQIQDGDPMSHLTKILRYLTYRKAEISITRHTQDLEVTLVRTLCSPHIVTGLIIMVEEILNALGYTTLHREQREGVSKLTLRRGPQRDV